jgi:hypothetical protein
MNINKLTLLEVTGNKYIRNRKYKVGLFECECGGTIETNLNYVKYGYTKSCGCLRHNKKVKHKKNRPVGLKYRK